MLALSRRIGERIFIDGGVVVTVLSVRNRQVCIGIDAPKTVRIRREEIGQRPHRPRPLKPLREQWAYAQ
jgi:carbon storage regulator